MSVRTKLGIAFSITALFLLAVGIAAILLINQLNPLLEQETRYDVQMRLAADTIAAMRLQPTQTQQHLARLTDLDNWANTRDERILVHQARDEVMHDRAISGAIGKLEQLSAVYRDGAAAVHQKLLRVHRRAVLWATIAIGESFVLLIIFTFLVREWLVKPVLLLRATSEQLAAGTLAQPVRANQGGGLSQRHERATLQGGTFGGRR
jgi:nitrate/nitrite-specific signal transduction histidine kinase